LNNVRRSPTSGSTSAINVSHKDHVHNAPVNRSVDMAERSQGGQHPPVLVLLTSLIKITEVMTGRGAGLLIIATVDPADIIEK